MGLILAIGSLIAAGVPALLFFRNLRSFQPPPAETRGRRWAVSVLIPARNEEHSIGRALESVLANDRVDLDVIVLDDGSTDATARIVAEVASRDPRVRLETSPPLPAGWCGKQHACAQLATLARHDLLLFLDADVRLHRTAIARLCAFREASGAALVSGFPHQETGTFLERLLLPLIHFLLLGFLPLDRMRGSLDPAYGAGCGQVFLTSRAAYQQCGGHSAIRESLHDGLKLPRLYRAHGLRTDLCDLTDLVECRMYHTSGEVWRGLSKNATEGVAAWPLIGPMTLLLGFGQILPWLLICLAPAMPLSRAAMALLGLSGLMSLAIRITSAHRFRQPLLSAVLHPLGVALFLTIQWSARLAQSSGRPQTWKGRSYGEFSPAGSRESSDPAGSLHFSS